MLAEDGGSLRIAFVSAPGSSVFMTELLDAVAGSVRGLHRRGVEVITHRGLVSDVADARTVAVVVPHEYGALAPQEPPHLRARTVAFGVEHPGTTEFETSAHHAAGLAAWFEIAPASVAELARRGRVASSFPLGYVPGWDRWHGGPGARPVDVAYLGTADERRLGILAGAAADLAGLRTELVIPPHEQMTGPRPDFLTGADKWDLLARSKVLVNLHRGEKTSLEWVRVLEAAINGCVVVTEPSDDLGPLRADEHLVVADPDRIGAVARELVLDEARRAAVARAAYGLVSETMDMSSSATALVDACARVLSVAPPSTATPQERLEPEPHPAGWLPAPAGGPAVSLQVDRAPLPRAATGPDHRLSVLCTRLGGDGGVGSTRASVQLHAPDVAVHVRRGGETAHRGAARNRLLEASDEPLLAVLDAGDELLDDTLLEMAARLAEDDELDAAVCLATYGDTLVNVVVPDERRLSGRAYLTRGYVVRRSTLEELGGFTEDPALADLVDHHFWLSLTARGGRTASVRRIGLALRPHA